MHFYHHQSIQYSSPFFIIPIALSFISEIMDECKMGIGKGLKLSQRRKNDGKGK